MAAYSVEDLKEVIEDHVVFVRVPVLANGTDGELNDECTEQLDKIRSRSGSVIDPPLLGENESIFDGSRARSASNALQDLSLYDASNSNTAMSSAAMEALNLPSNAIIDRDTFTTLLVPVSVIDESSFTGIASESEVKVARTRSSSAAIKDYHTTVQLDSDKKYYIYISSNYTSSAFTDNLTDINRIWICGEMPEKIPSNFIHLLPTDAVALPHSEKWRQKFKAPPAAEFVEAVLRSDYCMELVKTLQERQDELWIKGYITSAPFTRLLAMEKVRCFGLPPATSTSLNNKIYQLMLLKDRLPVPKFATTTIAECERKFDDIASADGVFLALEYGSAGSGTFHIRTKEDMVSFASVLEGAVMVNMCEWLTLNASVSVDILIASPEEVIVYGIIDQVYGTTSGLMCMGSNYPADLDEANRKMVVDISKRCGSILAETGTRGYVSIDVSRDGPTDTWYFTEINARYPGSVSERLCMMEACRPKDHPTTMDLELMAVRDGSFGGCSLWDEPNCAWSRRRILAEADFELGAAMESIREQLKAEGIDTHGESELELFTAGVNGGCGAAVLGFLEGGSLCKRGATLGKLVVVAPTVAERDSLRANVEKILESIIPLIAYG